jgi:hypothetical protein
MKNEEYPARGVLLTLPAWLEEITSGKDIVIPDPEERMRWIIGLSRQNVEHASGGPVAGPCRNHGHRVRPEAPADLGLGP